MHYVLQGLYAGTQITVFFLLSKLPLLSIHDLCSHKGTFSAWFLFQPVLEQSFHERKRGERKRGEGRDALGKPSLSPPFQCWNSAGTCLLEECRAVFLVDLFTALRVGGVWEREIGVWDVCVMSMHVCVLCICVWYEYVHVCDVYVSMCASVCDVWCVCMGVYVRRELCAWEVRRCDVHVWCAVHAMCVCVWCVCMCGLSGDAIESDSRKVLRS